MSDKETAAIALADKVADYIEATPYATAGDWFNSFRPLVKAYREACNVPMQGPMQLAEFIKKQNHLRIECEPETSESNE